jgi:hypothetical protein
MTNPNMHTEHMDDEGEITDGAPLSVATFYSPCVGLINGDGYLRVVCDAPGHHVETRVDHATLIKAGWNPPADREEQLTSLLRQAADYMGEAELSPATDWWKHYFERVDPAHMVLTDEGWEPGSIHYDSAREDIPVILDEVNAPEGKALMARAENEPSPSVGATETKQ